MENHNEPDDKKLLPEWGVKADDQIIFLAVALVVILGLLGYGCTQFGGEESPLGQAVEQIVPGDVDLSDVENDYAIDASYRNGTAILTGVVASEELRDQAGRDALNVDGVTNVRNNLTIAGEETTATTTATTTAPTTTTTAAAADLSPEVAAAVASFGAVNGSADGTTAVLEGFVGNQGESTSAETEALGVVGITDVDNRLRILQPDVEAALASAGVADPEASMVGTVATLRGVVPTADASAAAETAAGMVEGVTAVVNELRILETDVAGALVTAGVSNSGVSMDGTVATVTGLVDSEEQRTAALAAAAAVPGVTEVIDQLQVAAPAEDVVAQINELFELNPIQFASGSAEILPVSFPILDEASALLARAPAGTNVTVEGYTDTQGPAEANLDLSQGRADAVRTYLVDKGISGDSLVAAGRGETTEFGTDLAANRRVQLSL